jgi:hypothetical protein
MYTRNLVCQLRDNSKRIGRVYNIIADFFGNIGICGIYKMVVKELWPIKQRAARQSCQENH